jgi:hypothetical protein
VLDVFTTRATAPDGRSWQKVRVLFGDGWLYVFEPDAQRRPSIAASEPLTGDPVDVGGRWYLPTAAGNWELLGPCGCSAAAKVWARSLLDAVLQRA